MQKTSQPVKQNIQTLYARILEGIRAQLDEAETLYLRLCQTAITGMVQMPETDSASSCRKIDLLSAQYEERLQSIIQDTITVYRRPIQVFPVADAASMIETMETYNAQFEELERILDQLCKENSIPTRIQVQNQSIWKSIVNSIDLKKEFKNQFDETASSIKHPKSPAAGYTGCKKQHNNRKVQTMNLKSNILICGPSQYNISDLLCAATPEGTITEPPEEDSRIPRPEEAADSDEKPKNLVHRFVETPVANFFEANEITDLGEEGAFPENLSMGNYVKKIEAELHSAGRLADDAKINAVWFCTNGEVSFMDEAEKDFIRSAAGFPNAVIVSSPTIISKRTEFRKEIDALTGLAGSRRVVIAPSMSNGMNFSTLVSGVRCLVEKTKLMYLDSVDASDEEKEAYEVAWTEFYGARLAEWQDELNESLSCCIEQAAGRANFILGKQADMTLTELVKEGIDLLGELVDILRGNDEEEDRPGKTALAHTAELKDNIEIMICEIAACYGHAADKHGVELVLRHSKASGLPKDAAAITYAVAQVAKAVYEPGTEYESKDLLRIYSEAKEEAMQMEFKPHDDDNPFATLDGDFELNEEDLDDSGETRDADGVNLDGEPTDDVHEPVDALPEDCRVNYEDEEADIKAVTNKYLLPDDPPIMAKALELIFGEQQISTSHLQRELGIGYNKAADIVDKLEQRHVISASLPGGQKRAVLIHNELNKTRD